VDYEDWGARRVVRWECGSLLCVGEVDVLRVGSVCFGGLLGVVGDVVGLLLVEIRCRAVRREDVYTEGRW
jgi:hypothetical protein